ncbi:MAG: hypothetical protein HC923_03070 [Myxococcales bacterium]|nr:hypothetical protein [Myxococcales bacterium]
MTENRVLAVLVGLLAAVAFWSWHRDENPALDRVRLLRIPRADFASAELVVESSTVTLELRTGYDGEPYPWIRVLDEKGSRFYVGGPKVEELIGSLVTLEAERTLGHDLDAETLRGIGLSPPVGRFTLLSQDGGKRPWMWGEGPAAAPDPTT